MAPQLSFRAPQEKPTLCDTIIVHQPADGDDGGWVNDPEDFDEVEELPANHERKEPQPRPLWITVQKHAEIY